MVNGHETPEGRNPDSRCCTCASVLAVRFYFWLWPLSILLYPFWQSVCSAASNASELSVNSILCACMWFTHSELHNCTPWHCSLCFFFISKFHLSLQDIIQDMCLPTGMLSAFPESWNYKDREPWEKRSHRLAPLSQKWGNENKGSDLMF